MWVSCSLWAGLGVAQWMTSAGPGWEGEEPALLFVTLRGPAWGQRGGGRGEHSSRYGWRRSPTYRRGERRGCPQVGRSLLGVGGLPV